MVGLSVRPTAAKVSIGPHLSRSHASGYGHDAAEIEAEVEPGDDPDEVADRLRERIGKEILLGIEGRQIVGELADLRRRVDSARSELDRFERAAESYRDAAKKEKDFLTAVNAAGIKVPNALDDLLMPF